MKLGITWKELAAAAGGRIINGNPEEKIDSFITDSRKIKEGDFFWAIKGNSFDANSPEILEKTLPAAKGWIISENAARKAKRLPRFVIAAEDTLKAMQNLASWHRSRFSIPIVSMTGSNGKSTTKEMMRSILSLKGKTCCNKGNFNNQLGVPLSLLELSDDDKFGVFELGASHPGDIDEIAALARPSAAIITNIAPSHLEFFGTLETIYETKTEILKHLSKGGILVYNADDAYLSRLASNKDFKLVSFGRNENSQVRVCEDGSLFFKNAGIALKLSLPYPGAHNLMNAAASAAAAMALGADFETIKNGLEHYSAPGMRMQEIKKQDVSIILDAYNANPQSMNAAFNEMKSRRRPIFFMLGDMKELGNSSEHYHRELGRNLAAMKPDSVFLAGPEMKAAAEEYQAAGGRSMQWADKLEGWLDEAKKTIINCHEGTFLIKASRSLRFERIIENIDLH